MTTNTEIVLGVCLALAIATIFLILFMAGVR
jgi:hypothetical protein